MGVEIRPVHPGEHEEAGRVTALAYREFSWEGADEYFRRLADVAARAQQTLVLVATENGAILGTVTLELDDRVPGGHDRPLLRPEEAHVRMLGVHPGARGRGIGRLLMDACVEEARRRGKRVLTLDTTEHMKVAVKLYEAMGFERGPDLEYEDGWRLRWYELRI